MYPHDIHAVNCRPLTSTSNVVSTPSARLSVVTIRSAPPHTPVTRSTSVAGQTALLHRARFDGHRVLVVRLENVKNTFRESALPRQSEGNGVGEARR
jgi:hypothetical protein